MKRKVMCVIVLAFLLVGAVSVASASPDGTTFNDSNQAEWALKSIVRMRLQNIIKGYEDGNFRPNSSVSEAEALVMVARWLDKEAAAQALANSALVIPGVNRMWAWGYVQYAVDNKWILIDDFQPNRAASRLWVARLLSRASYDVQQLPIELAAVQTMSLTFSDIGDLSPADRNFVALVSSKNWMQGYPDGRFMPQKPVTRAEMATLIDRNATAPRAFTKYNVTGTVVSVNATKIKIVKNDNAAVEYDIATNVVMYARESSTQITWSQIQTGEKVRILLNADNKAVVISIEN